MSTPAIHVRERQESGKRASRAQPFFPGKVDSGAQPWKSAFDAMMASPYASLSRTPKPHATVECGPYSKPHHGCTDEREDALAIYTLSLAWHLTRDKIIKYWQGQSTFVDGLTQETCRDFTHTGYGLSAISHTAETTRLQGQDLYPEVAERLRHALGFQGTYELGTAPPSWLCGGTIRRGLGPVTEVGYNALHYRLHHDMPRTQQLTEQQRPSGSNNLFVAWETPTHAENPN